jgi:hypothetical protein
MFPRPWRSEAARREFDHPVDFVRVIGNVAMASALAGASEGRPARMQSCGQRGDDRDRRQAAEQARGLGRRGRARMSGSAGS